MKIVKVSALQCCQLFSDAVFKKYVSKKVYAEYLDIKLKGGHINLPLASKLSHAIKLWAVKQGVTHYTHWFQPLTGLTAGKQVSFLELDGHKVIEKFDAKSLIKGETDASSFPNGGERMTFEARGYTVWDYTSPIVIQNKGNGNKVLLIPTAFCSYHGTALDEKTPLLRAIQALNKQGVKLLHTLGYKDVKKLIVNVGGEQEYFLIKKSHYLKRKDLVLTGRTLLGAPPIKSQEKHHHYFGTISNLMNGFMNDVNKELWKMGITAKLQHNEVAPCQYEIVPIYSNVNIACDQNQILMETLQSVAQKYDLVVLLNEKPFKGVNGSGKHTNWSVATDTGINLLDAALEDKTLFLLFLTSVIAAIDEYAPLVRLSASYYGNDLRLGGDEAPPSIISIFVGATIANILKDIENGIAFSHGDNQTLETGVNLLPINFKDNCDRNRTSPFAFTGNKFEFRMVGSSQSLSFPNTVLISILAKKLQNINYMLENSALSVEQTVHNIIKQNVFNHKKVIFNGNGYDAGWQKEAKERNLPMFESCVESYQILENENVIDLFSSLHILKPNEIKLRQEILYKHYVESVLTETNCLADMVHTQVLPSLNAFLQQLLNVHDELTELETENTMYYQDVIKNLTNAINEIYKLTYQLQKNGEQLEKLSGSKEKALHAKEIMLPNMQRIRQAYDEIELFLPEQLKPFVNYNDILYLNGL